MTTRPTNYLCVHGHFYQPPRGNPITGEIGEEGSATPYHNWNEQIADKAYRPNAEIGNFERMSFDVGQTLMSWLQQHVPETYQRIVQSDHLHQERNTVGNALSSPFHHIILPLQRLRDKRTELAWGKAAFRHHFGRDPEGIWLPEMAYDLETLQAVRQAGYAYTIISQSQVDGSVDGAGPYWVDLENGQKLAVFVRNDELSNDLSFNISNVGGAGHWARNKLGSRHARTNALTLIATDGETFGHHHLGEEQFLHWLLQSEAPSMGYKVITLNQYIQEFPPTETIRLKMFSSWNCFHGVARWVTGCSCTPGDSRWKGALRRALDNLSDDMNELFSDVVRPHGVNAWSLRDGYSSVLLGESEGRAYLAQHITNLRSEDEARLLALLKAQTQILQAYTSDTFFFEDLDRLEPRYSIGNAAYAIYLARQATGEDLGKRFCNELYLASSGRSGLNGSQIYDTLQSAYALDISNTAVPRQSEAQPTGQTSLPSARATQTTPVAVQAETAGSSQD